MIEEAKCKGGRAMRILTEDEIQSVGKLAASMNTKQISGHLGICERTFRKIKNRQPAVSAAYKSGKMRAIAAIGDSLIKSALEGNATAMIFYLKTQAGWRQRRADDEDDDNDYNGPTPIIVEFIKSKPQT